MTDKLTIKPLDLGQKVRALITNGSVVTGTVTGILLPLPYMYHVRWTHKNDNWSPKSWDKRIPNWKEDLLYNVYLDEPRKPLTMQELRMANPDVSQIELEEKYRTIEMVVMTTHPRADLEVLGPMDE